MTATAEQVQHAPHSLGDLNMTHKQEREAFEAWFQARKRESWVAAGLDKERGPEPSQHWTEGLKDWLLEGWNARASLAQPASVPAGRSQHDADSAELRRLSKARDNARRERDALRAELAGMEAGSGHLSALVDDLRGLLAESMRAMKALHESATPDDGPEMNAVIPAGAFHQFVDDSAKLMHKIHVSPHELPSAPQAPQPAQAVPDAVQTLIASMRSDPDYAWSWHCNVAMSFVDAGGDHYTANQGAARFMRLFAGVDPAYSLPAAPQPEAQPHSMQKLVRLASICPELNIVNYGLDDVEKLNDWAVEVAQEIDRLAAPSAQAEQKGSE